MIHSKHAPGSVRTTNSLSTVREEQKPAASGEQIRHTRPAAPRPMLSMLRLASGANAIPLGNRRSRTRRAAAPSPSHALRPDKDMETLEQQMQRTGLNGKTLHSSTQEATRDPGRTPRPCPELLQTAISTDIQMSDKYAPATPRRPLGDSLNSSFQNRTHARRRHRSDSFTLQELRVGGSKALLLVGDIENLRHRRKMRRRNVRAGQETSVSGCVDQQRLGDGMLDCEVRSSP